MRVFAGDDRGQIKYISLLNGKQVKWSTEMKRSREVTKIIYTGSKERSKLTSVEKIGYEHESEITIGRVNGIVQAFDVSSVAITLENDAKYQDISNTMKPVRSLKCNGRIVYLKNLTGVYDKSYNLDDHILIVTDANEIYVVKWTGSFHLGREGDIDDWQDAEEIQMPLDLSIRKYIDFKAKFEREARCRTPKHDGFDLNKKSWASEKEMAKIINRELVREGGVVDDLVKYAWTVNEPYLSHKDIQFTIRGADVDVFSGQPRVMICGNNLLLRIFNFTTGEPLFTAKNQKHTTLRISYSANGRICAFIQSPKRYEDLYFYTVGTDQGKLLVYMDKDAASDNKRKKNGSTPS